MSDLSHPTLTCAAEEERTQALGLGTQGILNHISSPSLSQQHFPQALVFLRGRVAAIFLLQTGNLRQKHGDTPSISKSLENQRVKFMSSPGPPLANSCTTNSVRTVQPLWKTIWQFLKKLTLELPYDPANPLLGIHPQELKARTQTHYLHTHVCSSIIHNS